MPLEVLTFADRENPPCVGFTLEVRVFIPKKDYKLRVLVDKTCVNNQGRFAVEFKLEKKIDGKFEEIVFVSFKPKPDDTEAQQGAEKLLETKLTKKQLKTAKEELFPVAAELEGTQGPTPEQKKRLETAARKVVVEV